jgi:hypothetical protein
VNDLLTIMRIAATALRARLAAAHRTRESGYTTEYVLVTGLVILMAIAVVAIIVAKVTGAANAINLG